MSAEHVQALRCAALWPWLLGACLSVREEARPEQNACATCHGDAERGGDPLTQAAPPRDTIGNATTAYPGVGAHEAHLAASATHAALACSECHRVPEATDTPGHADSALPAEVQFGFLARSGGTTPLYDAAARRCADTYCHGVSSPLWTETVLEPCGGCHGLPPPAPHPQSDRCAACHSAVIDAERSIIEPARHVDGRVDLAPDVACDGCHGSAESPAPPVSLAGHTEPDRRGVGAHRAHLDGGANGRALACTECHPVPEATQPFRHPEGGAASVAFTGPARSREREPLWDLEAGACTNTWCHDPSGRGAAAPSWVHAAPLSCGDCHGMPPEPPHAAVQDCGMCHADVYAAGAGPIRQRERHVDGVVDVQVPASCTGCHASGEPSGSANDAAPEQGAHAVHLAPRGPARAVACSECHAVPTQVFDTGHVDSALPAEVSFSGVATAFEARPNFNAGTCAQTYCHGDSFIGARPSGGTATQPSWVLPGPVSTLSCQSCHGLPPPEPHPQPATDCSSCHRNVDAALQFILPETHVDGIVTFFLP